jgi:hypothetical protein
MQQPLRAAVVVLTLLLLAPAISFAADAPKLAAKRDPMELVRKIRDARVADLQKLSFFELNILKNAVFAAKGYKFAEDRQWLNTIFCNSYTEQTTVSANSALVPKRMMRQVEDTNWNLGTYNFPGCFEGEAIDEDQMKAVANVRIALFKKIEKLGSMQNIDAAIADEYMKLKPSLESLVIMGRRTHSVEDTSEYSDDGEPHEFTINDFSDRWRESILREVHGYNRMQQIIKSGGNFDAMELLGLYVGDIRFLSDMIEAQNGKQFQGVLGWEISQILGITETKADYDRSKLPVPVQVKLQLLEEIMQKIINSDLNDIPDSLQNKSIELIESYGSAAC